MKMRIIPIVAGFLALAIVCSPVAAAGTTGVLSQLVSHSRINSFLSGYTPGNGITPDVPAVPVPNPPSQPRVSASERIASLLDSDIGNWQPPTGRVYDLPEHNVTERPEYTPRPIPVFARVSPSGGQGAGTIFF